MNTPGGTRVRQRLAASALALVAVATQAQVRLPTEQPYLETGYAWGVHAHFNKVTVSPRDEQDEETLRRPRTPVPEEAGTSCWGGRFGGSRSNAHPRELNVTVGHAAGLKFLDTHGSGTATNWPADWPKKDAQGTGVRGGQECASGPDERKAPFWATSCRMDAALADPERFVTDGFRPARAAPDAAKWNSARNEKELNRLQGLPGNGE